MATADRLDIDRVLQDPQCRIVEHDVGRVAHDLPPQIAGVCWPGLA